MLYHFSHLKKFDNLEVNEESKKCAEIEFQKKKIYYNMKIKALKRLFISLKKILKCAKGARKLVLSKSIRLMKQFKSVLKQKNPEISKNAATIYKKKTEETSYIDLMYEKTILYLQEELSNHIYFISKELESTGNFKLEEGSKNDRWYQSCINLVKSRFQAPDFSEYKVEDLTVHRVLRIHNRFLRNRFEEKIEMYLDQSNPNYKKNFEYLFYGIDPSCPEEFNRIVESGYCSPEECEEKAVCPYMPLVNSVYAADKARIESFMKSKKENEKKTALLKEELEKFGYKIPPGCLLVCKVIIIQPQQDPRFPVCDFSDSFTKSYTECPIDSTVLQSGMVASFREDTTNSSHKVWFVHDNTLVLPEYLIHFDYEFPIKNEEEIDSFYIGETLLASLDNELRFARPYNDKETQDNID